MTDSLSVVERGQLMARIPSAGTRPEAAVRAQLVALGEVFGEHDRRLPGRPDFVLPDKRAVILVNGCFWHGHDCGGCRMPATRGRYWREKITANRARDARVQEQLVLLKWRVLVVWECAVRRKGAWADGELREILGVWIKGESLLEEVGGMGGSA